MIWPYQELPLQVREDLGVMAMKSYSTFPKTPLSNCLASYLGHSLGRGSYSLQRCNLCILQPQLIRLVTHELGAVTKLINEPNIMLNKYWAVTFIANTEIGSSYDFKLTKERNRRYPAQTITDTDYADDIALLANTPAQAEILLHSLEWAAAGIGYHVNAHKTEYMCFNQRGEISTQNDISLKLIDKFTYLGSSVSSINSDINMRLANAWIAINWLSVIWKPDLTNKMKSSFFKQQLCRYCCIDALHGR